MDILNFNDYKYLDWLHTKYCDVSSHTTYSSFLSSLYSSLVKSYRCEYVYKNELINKLLLKKYGTRHTVYYNEFRVNDSIVDMALFNGESKAFEIKTEYDSPRRLGKQIEDYKLLFDKCYLVIPAEKLDDYLTEVESGIGIITFSMDRGRIRVSEFKSAEGRNNIDRKVLMSCLRTEEYKEIVKKLQGNLPDMPAYEMFSTCSKIISQASFDVLHPLFLAALKKRKNNTKRLKDYPAYIRQMFLCLNLSEKKELRLIDKLNIQITHNHNVLSFS